MSNYSFTTYVTSLSTPANLYNIQTTCCAAQLFTSIPQCATTAF